MEWEVNKEVYIAMYFMSKGCKLYEREISDKNKYSYDLIPSCYVYMDKILQIIKVEDINPDHDLFIDLGCGVSPVLLYLSLQLEWKHLTGVEIEPYYVNLIRKMLHVMKVRDQNLSIIEGDISNEETLQLAKISSSKFIYMYMPIANHRKYEETIEKVWSMMSKGAIITDSFGPIGSILPEEDELWIGSGIRYWKK